MERDKGNFPMVTIAIPIYGVEKYIETCARSVFEQTYQNIEYLFINDCTKDKSIEVLQKVLFDYPNRKPQVRIINHKYNRGLSAARNTAVQNAKGDFIFHVDSDDYVETDAIEALVKKQQKENSDLVVGNYVIEMKEGTLFVKYLDISKSKEEMMVDCLNDKSSHSVWGILIRRSIYLDNDIKALEGVNIGEDWQAASQLLYYSEIISYIDKLTYHYMMSRNGSYTIGALESVTKKKKSLLQFVQTLDYILEKFLDKGDKYVDIINQKRAFLIQDAMIYCCKDGDRSNFFKMTSKLKSLPEKYYIALGNNKAFMNVKMHYLLFCIYLKICNLLKKRTKKKKK